MSPGARSGSLRVVIAGGGISGLSAAFFLQQNARQSGRQIHLTLLEASGRLGGALSTHRQGSFLLEEGADSLLRTKPSAIRLCEDLGITDSLIPTRPGPARTLIVRDGRLMPLPEGLHLFVPTAFRPLLTTRVVSWRGKLRMALDLLLPRGGSADESIGSFVRRRLGKEALERLVQPMVGGIWSGDPDSLSLGTTMPQWLEMEAEYRSIILALRAQIRAGRQPAAAAGARYGLFLTPRCGMGRIVEALEKRLPPATARTGVAVAALQRAGGVWRVITSEGPLEADALILALPVHVSAGLLERIDLELHRELSAIPSSSVATLNLVYRSGEVPVPPEGYGFVCPEVEKRALAACTFTSRKYEGRCDDSHVILRAYVTGRRILQQDDESLIGALRGDLRELLRIEAPPVAMLLRRFDRALPQLRTGHLERISKIEQRLEGLPGLALAGNALRGVGVSDCVDAARRAAETVQAVR